MPRDEEFAAILANIRMIVAGLPEVTERNSHSAPSFFMRDKKCLVNVWNGHHNDDRIAMWCAAGPGVQAELVELEPERFFVPPYVGHRGWIGLRLDVGVEWDEVEAILTDAYRLIAPKGLIKLLDGPD